ncbi:carbohydrate kinase family protein [candidate division KSB1 bacterium]|nr:carbohydrate kinase family protein [candidate division KSB1 bacterium]
MATLEKNFQYDAVCAGHICLDITPAMPDVGYQTLAEIFRPGKLVNVKEVSLQPGGPVANTGLALARLGIKTTFLAKVGADEFGRITTAYLRRAGGVEGIATVDGQTSSYSIVIAPPGIDRIFLHHPGPNDWFTSDDVDYAVVSAAKLFHLGYPPIMRAMIENEGYELTKTFRLAKQCGVTTSLDLSLPDPNSYAGKVNWRQILANVLPYIDLFLPSIEEVVCCLDPDYYHALHQSKAGPQFIEALPIEKYREFARQLLQMGCRVVVLKAGQRGLYCRTAEESQLYGMGAAAPANIENWAHRELWCPAFLIYQIVSATGSGDAAIAGFLAGLLRGLSLERTLKTAVCVGYQNLHQLDATSGIQSWEETQAILENDKLRPLEWTLDATEWYWDRNQALWFGPADIMIIK